MSNIFLRILKFYDTVVYSDLDLVIFKLERIKHIAGYLDPAGPVDDGIFVLGLLFHPVDLTVTDVAVVLLKYSLTAYLTISDSYYSRYLLGQLDVMCNYDDGLVVFFIKTLKEVKDIVCCLSVYGTCGLIGE